MAHSEHSAPVLKSSNIFLFVCTVAFDVTLHKQLSVIPSEVVYTQLSKARTSQHHASSMPRCCVFHMLLFHESLATTDFY